MRSRLYATMNLAAGAGLAMAVLLGGWWARDRGRHWEPPRWDRQAFVPLRAGADAGPATRTLWVVTINPRCPSCLATLRRLHAAWTRRARAQDLVALIVDSPARPGPRALRAIPPIPVWWDRENRWRQRWGHRLYGELLEFDASGTYRRSIPADAAVRGAESTAPALERRGGM